MVLAGPDRTVKDETAQPARYSPERTRSSDRKQRQHERDWHRDPGRKRDPTATAVRPVWNALISVIPPSPSDVHTIASQTATTA